MVGYKKGHIPWNKGLTKNDDERLQSISNKASQQMKREYENGTRDKFTITKKANKRCRELVSEGNWILQHIDRSEQSKKNCSRLKSEGRLGFQNRDIQLKARKTAASHSYGGSHIETKIKKVLDILDVIYIQQFRVNHPKLHKHYFIDFVIPEKRIAIECDGIEWHKNIEKDRYRQSIIEYYGWKVLRFNSDEIINNIENIKIELMDKLSEK